MCAKFEIFSFFFVHIKHLYDYRQYNSTPNTYPMPARLGFYIYFFYTIIGQAFDLELSQCNLFHLSSSKCPSLYHDSLFRIHHTVQLD